MKDLFEFKQHFDPILNAWFQHKKESYQHFNSGKSFLPMLAHTEHLLLKGGKRVRPYLVSLFIPEKKNDYISILIAIELFHLFCLIHDDVMDDAGERHHAQTTQRFLFERYTQEKRIGNLDLRSKSQAILLGDLVFSWVYDCLEELPVDRTLYRKIRGVFQQMVAEVMYGQSLDIDLMSIKRVTTVMITENMYYKTASYTFIRPLQMGLLLSGKEALMEDMAAFGRALGLAFQIQDDLIDMIGGESGKDQFRDIAEGEATLFSQYLFTHEEKRYRHTLGKYFHKQLTVEDKKALRTLMETSGAIAYGRTKIDGYYAEAKEVLARMPLDASVRGHLEEVIAFLEHRSY